VADLQLVIVDGPDAGREFDLAGAIVVGRDPDSGIPIEDAEASRRHASFSAEGSTVTVEDLGSTNGTFVNGERLTGSRTVGEGERVRIGTTVFEVRSTVQATRVGTAIPDEPVDPQATRVGGTAIPDEPTSEPPSEPPAGGPPPPSFPPPGPPPEPGPPAAGSPPPQQPGAAAQPGQPPAPYGGAAVGQVAYPIEYEADYPQNGIARWRPFLQGLLLFPQIFVLFFVLIAAWFTFAWFAWWAILFTGRYPRGAFNFLSGVLRWGERVNSFGSLMTEQYPPFTGQDDPSYPIRVRVQYPEGGIARWRPLVHWLLAIPHFIVVYFLGLAAAIALLISWFAIVFTRTYPPELFKFIAGVQRWRTRVSGYFLLMTEEYPPFSLD
jgi:hypothetical protein